MSVTCIHPYRVIPQHPDAKGKLQGLDEIIHVSHILIQNLVNKCINQTLAIVIIILFYYNSHFINNLTYEQIKNFLLRTFVLRQFSLKMRAVTSRRGEKIFIIL